jgi:hypothetical protein
MLTKVLVLALIASGVVAGVSRMRWAPALLTLFWVAVLLTLFSKYLKIDDNWVARSRSPNWSGAPVAIITSLFIVGLCFAAARKARRLSDDRRKRHASLRH